MNSSAGLGMVRRLLLLVTLMLAGIQPARADDIAAAGRGVVRIVTIAVVGDEVVGFGHGSGFAVAPNRVVTNAHVVELAARYPDNVVIGVVPSEGQKSFQGRLIAFDPDRDLALIEFSGVRLPPLTLFTGPLQEGEPMVALGYPGNVDLATAQSAAAYITPQSPVRSQGNFAGRRTLIGTSVLLHTASIARGNSGGPLLDRCGRVLGVNSAITRAEEGDSSFGFAIAGSELTAFLREAQQDIATVNVECVSIEERLAQDRSAAEQAAEERAARERAEAERTAAARAEAIAQARAQNEAARENYMAAAALLLVLGALAVGGAGLLLSRGRSREALWVAIGGVVLMLGAVALFFSRPSFDESTIEAIPEPAESTAAAAIVAGRMLCTLVPERSRVTVSSTNDVPLEVTAEGCVNGRTQYAEANGSWERILVPSEEQTVSVLTFDAATRTYTNTRYLLSAEQMSRARELRSQVELKQCSADQDARAQLATRQQAIRAALPEVFNEKLVYRCDPAVAAAE
ncbi:S1C family serine protease [Sphingosinithalassobacter sp. CS137]|uniref:S1C family serine protease n=1 Tax=Sphingosinithalassobacter sp. CS137 TaxID=2762748 RepID=UPI0021D2FBC9|nr:trypsin-like peptidase domain-containing protein [Sphingosinithalassobacter sp. CS137]